MDIKQLKVRTAMHRAYAESFKYDFRRLLHREPSEAEAKTLENATLCMSGMRLELIAQAFAEAQTPFDVEDEVRFMCDRVDAAKQEILQAIETVAQKHSLRIEHRPGRSHLALEEHLLQQAENCRQAA